jgi:hypothetical protein
LRPETVESRRFDEKSPDRGRQARRFLHTSTHLTLVRRSVCVTVRSDRSFGLRLCAVLQIRTASDTQPGDATYEK